MELEKASQVKEDYQICYRLIKKFLSLYQFDIKYRTIPDQKTQVFNILPTTLALIKMSSFSYIKSLQYANVIGSTLP